MSRLEQLEKLWSADPTDADVAYMIAQERAREGAHSDALGWYDECLKLDSAYHYAYFHKARSQEAMGENGDAVATLEAGLAAATAGGDAKASGEIGAYLGEIRG